MSSEKAYSRARPVRVAFLVEDNSHSNAMLDAIFQECMGRWGGRFSLLIPTTINGPQESYLNWLETFDPDVIYSYVDLNSDVIERLHERFYPSYLIKHNFYNSTERDVRAFRPKLPIDCLKVTSIIPLATLPSIESKNARFLEAKGSLATDKFILDSFGLFTNSVSHSFYGAITEYGKTITLVADNECQPRQQYGMQTEETLPDIIAFLDFVSNKHLISMSQLSSMASPRLDMQNNWGESFNLVIGDSFLDRIVYWNARFLYPKWRDRERVDLRMPSSYCENPETLKAIAKYITKRNHVSGHHSNSNPKVTIRSGSLSAARLEEVAAVFRTTSGWIQYGVETFSSTEVCVPSAAQLENATFALSENFMVRSASLWNETDTKDDSLELNPVFPEPLKYCPAHLQSSHEGSWAIDINITRKADHSLVSNIQHTWHFPRRLRITRAFIGGYEISSPNSTIMLPRVTNSGLLTVYANVSTKPLPIKLPDDEDAITSSLLSGRDWWPFTSAASQQMPTQLLSDVRRSPNGRYFAGTLGVFGSLQEANKILLHKFWREQFDKLGASALKTEKRREAVEGAIINRLRNTVVELPRDKTKLANIILNEAEQLATSVPCRDWKELERDFQSFQAQDLQSNPPQNMTDAELDDWQKDEMKSFKRGVQDLCEREVLYQGYEHKCSKCLNKTWFAIENLGPKIKCNVCMNEEPAPVDKPWQFRLNDFIREALRMHGVWPLFWAISKIQNNNDSSFYFSGPMDVYVNSNRWEGNNDTDIDLILISEGIVRMCEAKQSERQLTDDVITTFADLMIKLRPNIATLAIMENITPSMRSKFERFKQLLTGHDIEAELLTLENQDFDDSTRFYGQTRIRIL